FLPSCVITAKALRQDPAVPRRAKIALLIAVLWVVSPIDLLPEFLPIIGPLDDVVAVILLLRFAARSIPRDTLLAAWPSDPALLERLLGRDRALSRAFCAVTWLCHATDGRACGQFRSMPSTPSPGARTSACAESQASRQAA